MGYLRDFSKIKLTYRALIFCLIANISLWLMVLHLTEKDLYFNLPAYLIIAYCVNLSMLSIATSIVLILSIDYILSIPKAKKHYNKPSIWMFIIITSASIIWFQIIESYYNESLNNGIEEFISRLVIECGYLTVGFILIAVLQTMTTAIIKRIKRS